MVTGDRSVSPACHASARAETRLSAVISPLPWTGVRSRRTAFRVRAAAALVGPRRSTRGLRRRNRGPVRGLGSQCRTCSNGWRRRCRGSAADVPCLGTAVEAAPRRLSRRVGADPAAQPRHARLLRNTIRLHIDCYLGAQPVARLTGRMVDAWPRKLEASGRADGRVVSARTVLYMLTILRSALGDAVSRGGSRSTRPTGPRPRARPRTAPRRCRPGLRRSSPDSSVGRTPRIRTSPRAGGCWGPPGCAAVRRWPCGGATSTRTPAGSRCVAASAW
jgi:hypothetical protein